ncbi:nucleic-acid-binding protein from transposon X-element [Trichonephila clavipes]|uniref:Nucleic-acid-binding protein from transposon X-element n=1 Tax=Trichonephila clavipes TaxID=2585209 RepID=A0A8X6T192_TRICX|nr:nucleic-acid-binding protein from transposon X-element [Trichonephila clavipes]
MRIYPETPSAYNQIRRMIEEEKLESFTFQFLEEKEYRVVIKGMPADMPVEDIIEELEEMGIHPKECRVMISRKTGLPIPLFSAFLEKNQDNRNIYNLKELCSMKIEVDTMRKKFGPAQCYRCQVFFPQFQILHKEPQVCQVCLHPKGKLLGGKSEGKKDILDAAKAKTNQPPQPPLTQAQETSSSRNPQVPPPATKEKPQARDLSSSTQGTSSTRSHPATPSTNHQNPPSMMDTFAQVNDPEVVEMMGVIQQFVTISKSDKPRAQKAMELLTFLQIKFHF